MRQTPIKVLELFAGIGACSKALEKLGIEHEIVDAVEIDKYAIKSFNAIHNTNFEPQDIIKWDKDIEVDLVCGGSPCQDFSLAGLQAGGDEGSGTRSSLMYETIRIVEKLKPKYVIWENVKNVISKKHRHNFDNYLSKMEELGYKNYWQVLNAKDYGIPQNRERVFTVSIRDDSGIDFKFPPKQELKLKLKDMLEDEVDKKYYLDNSKTEKIVNSNFMQDWKDPKCIQVGQLNIKGHDIIKRIYSDNGISPTLTNMQGGNRQPKINSGLNVRKLTPKECWRLMGFDDADFDKAQAAGISNTQLYKQAGNSIVVNVLEAIFENLLLGGKNE